MNHKHTKTLQAIFQRPRSGTIVFADIEALIVGLGGEIQERKGSRVRIALQNELWHCHRPHPEKEAKRYQIGEAETRVGIRP